MIGTAISAGAGLLGGLIGGIKAGKQRKKALRALNEEKKYNEDLFNREYSADPLERSDNAAMLRSLREGLKARTAQSAATAAVTGATPEAMLAEKESANNAIANVMSNMGAMNQQYKDNVMNRYLNQRNNLSRQQQQIYGQSAEGWTNYMQNSLNSALGSVGTLEGSVERLADSVFTKKS